MVKLFTSIIFGLLVVLLVAAKPDKPPKPDDVEDIYLVPAGVAVIDGDLGEWTGQDCAIPLHWAGQKNKEILATVCLRYATEAGILYVKGEPTAYNLINDKPDSMHMKIDKVKLWEDTDRPPDGALPDFAVTGAQIGIDGHPVANGFEAAAYVAPGTYDVVIHISICPAGDCNDGAGQSSRTLRGVVLLIE